MKTILNVRVDPEFKDEIDRLAKEDGISSSECARNILYDNLDYYEEDKSFYTYYSSAMDFCVDPYMKRKLPQLTLWLFVNLYSNEQCSEQNLKSAKEVLEKLSHNETLSNELRFEFSKALYDIDRVLALGLQDTQLYFISPDNMYTLNFNLLFTEVHDLIGDY